MYVINHRDLFLDGSSLVVSAMGGSDDPAVVDQGASAHHALVEEGTRFFAHLLFI